MRRVTTEPSDRKALQDWMVPPPYVNNAELRRKSTETKLFADWPGPVDGSGRVTPDEEILLFKQLHYSAYRLSKIYKAAHRQRRAGQKREYNKWVQRYSRIRTRLIEGNLGLVYDLIGRSRFENLDRDDMVSEGMMALLRAADTFDPWRGYRFSTYACNAIIRAFSRAALANSKRRSKILGPYDPEFEDGDQPEVRRDEERSLFEERLRLVMGRDEAELSDVEKKVLERRFPMNPQRKRQTLESIGRQMKVSKERVRQIQLSAIAKLRRVLLSDPVLQ